MSEFVKTSIKEDGPRDKVARAESSSNQGRSAAASHEAKSGRAGSVVREAGVFGQSAQLIVQRAMNSGIQNSPRMVSQRAKLAQFAMPRTCGAAGRMTGQAAPIQYFADRQYGPVSVPISHPTFVAQRLTDEKLIKTKNFGTAYYQFDYDSAGNIDDFSNNRATTTPVGADPVDSSSHVNLDEGTGSGQGEMRSGNTVDIVSSSRSRHFSIADRMVDGTPDDRKGTYTWHHLTPEYEMVLVDMAVHGGFGHKGGKSFWK
ncbi:MAG: HNH endonuclease [Betaproteobacteria bacterium]|nr:HNH endonuclease [Betaproteobacteria bacterium]